MCLNIISRHNIWRRRFECQAESTSGKGDSHFKRAQNPRRTWMLENSQLNKDIWDYSNMHNSKSAYKVFVICSIILFLHKNSRKLLDQLNFVSLKKHCGYQGINDGIQENPERNLRAQRRLDEERHEKKIGRLEKYSNYYCWQKELDKAKGFFVELWNKFNRRIYGNSWKGSNICGVFSRSRRGFSKWLRYMVGQQENTFVFLEIRSKRIRKVINLNTFEKFWRYIVWGNCLNVVFWPSTRPNLPFQSDTPEGSDTFQRQLWEEIA